jgi:uncharacterized protein YggE
VEKDMQKAAVLALAVVLFLTAACGGGGNDQGPETRANKGLGVAFAAQAAAHGAGLGTSSEAATGSGGGGQAAVDTTRTSAGEIALQSAGGGLPGLTVLGYGMASASADSAILELYFSTGTAVKPDAVPGSTGSSDSAEQTTSSIRESDLQPVIDAITGQGVSRDDIEFLGGSYYDPFYSSATLRVTVRDLGKLGAIIQAGTDAAGTLSNISLQGSYVSYTISDCAGLEQQALQAARQDAEARADVLADALSVTRGAVIAASTYSYSTFGGTPCDGGTIAPYPIGGVTYAEGQASQVQLSATITVTYDIQ